MKLKSKNNELILFNETRKLSFVLTNQPISKVITKNIESLNVEGCVVEIEKKSEREEYLILDNYKIKIPPDVSYEIYSRMLLLNKMLRYPKTSEEESEEIEET